MDEPGRGDRRVPTIPPAGERLRVVIDSDAKNEIDDQYAIALALACPARFAIEGFVGANFDNSWGGPGSVAKSVAEIELVLDKAGMAGSFPVLPGSDPMRYSREPSPSEGVDFIVESAMASTPDDPLWVVGLGSATNIASAWLTRPEIADRVVAFWHGRTHWPEKCVNFNVFGDVHAARTLFGSNLPFVLFDTGTYLRATMDETERRLAGHGELGRYLHEYRTRRPEWTTGEKGFFDLGDVAALADPAIACWEETDRPEVGWDLTYRFTGELGRMLRCYHIDRDAVFDLLYRRMTAFS
ncbi:MAG: nucleoside hydrolase [Spirochaetota bacterium]